MPKNLVIVESPAKAKTINKYLGKDYVVRASLGHIRDLPEGKLGVDIEHKFKPEYVNSKSKSKVIKELKEAAKGVERILLAPDPDREGEAIAWHLKEILKGKVPEDCFERVTYNEITRDAILKAFAKPTKIDQHKVDAQQARRVLDRLVGYMVSPLLWRQVRGGSSAGRVQTVALRLVCEREKEILAFVPEAYWVFGAQVAKRVVPKDPFRVSLVRINEEKADVRDAGLSARIRADLEHRDLRVASIQRKKQTRRAPPPFITSTLQQAASSALSFSPSRTMSMAQKLYEGLDMRDGEGTVGLITYMRTDSPVMAEGAVDACRVLIERTYGSDYLPEVAAKHKGRDSAQAAHECIRPTDFSKTPERMKDLLDPALHKLYSLIWSRAVASQMAPAVIDQLMVDFDAPGRAGADTSMSYVFRASASDILFPGYMKVLGREKKKDDEQEIPPLKEGEMLDCLEWLCDEKMTQPPSRYSEASLIKAMEENGVGRPSTYASIVTTLYTRKYVDNEKKSLRPTDAGMRVHDFLVAALSTLFDVDFTAQMELRLDRVEQGELEWTAMLGEFYTQFTGWIGSAKAPEGDPAEAAKLLELLLPVREWAAPNTVGKRTYSDEKFVNEVRAALEKGKAVSARQMDSLRKVTLRYREQIPVLDEAMIESLGLKSLEEQVRRSAEPPSESTVKKLELLASVEFEPARTVGKKVYDDAVFAASLRQQVESGKKLSDNQMVYLDRLVVKYGGQVAGFEEMRDALGLEAVATEEDRESGPLLALMQGFSGFSAPVQRGNRTWSDEEFYQSLDRQYKTKKSLSPKQRATLKKMVIRYAAALPGYEESWEKLGLPPPGTKEKKARG